MHSIADLAKIVFTTYVVCLFRSKLNEILSRNIDLFLQYLYNVRGAMGHFGISTCVYRPISKATLTFQIQFFRLIDHKTLKSCI